MGLRGTLLGHDLQQGYLAWASLQTKKTYHVYHLESMNAETKLREAERQEEKRSGKSALPTTTAASATTTTITIETELHRKGSLKKGGRLVEKVGLEGHGPPISAHLR